MATLTVIRNGVCREIEAKPGEPLLTALRRAGVFVLDAPCGGNGKCGKCRVVADGRETLACQTPVTDGCTVILPDGTADAVVAQEGAAERFPLTPADGLGAAVDVGTTTVVVYLYDLSDGRRLGVRSGMNRQRAFGADVISRIQYAGEHADGLTVLGQTVRGQVNGWLEELCAEAGRSVDELKSVVIAANTVMEHIYAGLSPSSIAAAPFTPLSLFGTWEDGGAFGLPTGARVYLAPAVAGYVGGDITAGLLASGAYRAPGNVLFLDVGTNGEIALGGARGFLCCAAAAGPAFEGACISQGMSAVRGAVSAVELESGGLKLTVLGGGDAEGICGSGLVDALAVMLKLGAVDETGRLLPPDEAPEQALPYVDEDDDGAVFRLTETVCVTEGDVRQLQLAKAAIAAGVYTLLDEAGLDEDDIDCLYLAGGFGNYIRKESAAAIGLLPERLLGRIVSVGNSAGAGASAALLSRTAREELAALSDRCRYLELSGSRTFSGHYIACMAFE